MPIPEPVTWTLAGLMAGWEYREQLGEGWDAVLKLLRLRKFQIAITGLSGAGKSTLIDDFTGESSKVGYTPPQPSLKTDTGKTNKYLPRTTKLLAVPGENAAFRQISLNEVFKEGKALAGVIHVVSNGYPAIRESISEKTQIESGIDTPNKLRIQTLAEEIRDLQETIIFVRQHYAKYKKNIFFSVLVNKYDLYALDPEPAREHYHIDGNSDFSAGLKDLQNALGKDNIQISCDPVSAWPEDFSWNNIRVESNLSRQDRDKLTTRYLLRLKDLLGATENP